MGGGPGGRRRFNGGNNNMASSIGRAMQNNNNNPHDEEKLGIDKTWVNPPATHNNNNETSNNETHAHLGNKRYSSRVHENEEEEEEQQQQHRRLTDLLAFGRRRLAELSEHQPNGAATTKMSRLKQLTKRNNNKNNNGTVPMNTNRTHLLGLPRKNNRAPFPRSSRNNNETLNRELLQHAVHYPPASVGQLGPYQHIPVAIVRDPLERFISALGQAMGAAGSGNNRIGNVLKEACVVNATTSQQALRCLANYVKTHGTWIEIHFTPMALVISFATMFLDVPVAVFYFTSAIEPLVQYMGKPPSLKERNGQKEGYRKHSLLANMTVADYDDDIVKTVCQIYHVDVLMMQSLNLGNVSRCVEALL